MTDDLRTRAEALYAEWRYSGSPKLYKGARILKELLAELDRVTAERDEALEILETVDVGSRAEIERLRDLAAALEAESSPDQIRNQPKLEPGDTSETSPY